MDSREPDVKKRVAQFYKLLSANGLKGKSELTSAEKRRTIEELFPD